MADFRMRRIGSGKPKIGSVPIAVTPDGFWCCPSQAALQRTIKNQSQQSKNKGLRRPPPGSSAAEEKRPNGGSSLRSRSISDDQRTAEEADKRQEAADERSIAVAFGPQETSDLQVVLRGKEGVTVKIDVHRDILSRNSSFFAEKIAALPSPSQCCVELPDFDDAEIFVETVGMMYCGGATSTHHHQLIKHTVPTVLRILKVAEMLGFSSCVKACLDYLEAAPWVGEAEEENVVSSVRRLPSGSYGVAPLLKRVISDADVPASPSSTLASIVDMVIRSTEDRGRREIKSLVLKLVKDDNAGIAGSADTCSKTLYSSCRDRLEALLSCCRQASEAERSGEMPRKIALEADNLLWLVDVLAVRRSADEFVTMWASQDELALHHQQLSVMVRHPVSWITSRIVVGIGRGEMLPGKEDRRSLLEVWLQPLIGDYHWLRYGCRTFDAKAVEDGIGRTILTLPLDDQQRMLLLWMGRFLSSGDRCPDLQRAFEVWWRRTFVRPHVDADRPLQRDPAAAGGHRNTIKASPANPPDAKEQTTVAAILD